jgi:hypothetical protein
MVRRISTLGIELGHLRRTDQEVSTQPTPG